LALLAACGAGVLWGTGALVARVLVARHGFTPERATAGLTVVAALAMATFGLWRPLDRPADVPPQAWFLYLGVVTAALALLAFIWGAARLKPMALTVATLLEQLTAAALSALFLRQSLSAPQWLGGAMLLGSIWLLGKRSSTRAMGSEP